MNETYAALATFAQTWGLVFFIAMFATAVGYALRPSRSKMFENAARMPLAED